MLFKTSKWMTLKISNFIYQNRRSWLDESRLTQSQFSIGFDSGGNESDISGEEPQSIASDTALLKNDSMPQITAQRKSSDEPLNSMSKSTNSFQPLIREELLRTSRNTLPGYVT